MITHDKIKEDMKELWKETFHDSDRYIGIVFNNYFSRENAFYRYDENRLIASLLRIPYEFQILTKDGAKSNLRGVYLCGLATVPEYRRRGIMAELMNEAEETSRREGYDLAFLIPADSHLRHYYEGKGYRTASWRIEEPYTQSSGTYSQDTTAAKLPKLHIYAVKDFMIESKRTFIHALADWCHTLELSRQNNTIIHSERDFIAIMAENENSIFLTEDTFDPEFPILAKVTAVVFPALSDATGVLSIVGQYGLIHDGGNIQPKKNRDPDPNEDSSDNADASSSRYLDFISEQNIFRRSLTVDRRKNVSKIREVIMDFFDVLKINIVEPYLGKDPLKSGAEPYAMVKPLKTERGEIENLRIEISLMLD